VPPAQTPALQASPVDLVVSVGAGSYTVPNVVGASGDAAKQILAGEPGKLIVAVASEANDTVPAGSVIRTEPSADAVVDKGSPITIVISTGPTQVQVPLLVGLREENARSALLEAGLIADPVTYKEVPFDSPNAGLVLEQSVPRGTAVDQSSSIGLVIGQAGPEPTTTTAAPTTTSTTTTTTAPPTTTTTIAPATVPTVGP
jgi:serine/threonine-protein kinase